MARKEQSDVVAAVSNKSANSEVDFDFGETAREAWVKRALAALPAGTRVLDAGAGMLRYKSACSHLRYVSQDFGQYDGHGDGRGIQKGHWDAKQVDLLCDITEIPEPDASFDAVLCVSVLEHVPDPRRALSELTRLLRNGGTLILTAPFSTVTHCAPYHYYSGFTRYFYEKHLPELGLRIVELCTSGNYFEHLRKGLFHLSTLHAQTRGQLDAQDAEALVSVVNMLQRLGANDRDTHELMNFGWRVLAVKD